MKLGNHRQMGNIEIGEGGTSPDRGLPRDGQTIGQPRPEELRNLPKGSCGAIFERAPLLARDSRTMSPCTLHRGHTGAHENAKGVSWGTRRASSTTSTRTQDRSTPVPARTDAQRRARMQELEARMRAQNAPLIVTGAHRGYSAPSPSGPVQRAVQAARLAQKPSDGTRDWLHSQLNVIVDHLERAGNDLIHHIEATCASVHSYHGQMRHFRGLVHVTRVALAPGALTLSGQQQAVNELRKALRDLAQPLAEQERQSARAAAALAEASRAPRPQPAAARQEHPWFAGHVA